jgi:predicted phage tail protein
MTALPPDAGRPEFRALYLLVLGVLSLVLVGCVAAWIALALSGRDMPDGLASLSSLIAGGLIGVIAPSPTGDR